MLLFLEWAVVKSDVLLLFFFYFSLNIPTNGCLLWTSCSEHSLKLLGLNGFLAAAEHWGMRMEETQFPESDCENEDWPGNTTNASRNPYCSLGYYAPWNPLDNCELPPAPRWNFGQPQPIRTHIHTNTIIRSVFNAGCEYGAHPKWELEYWNNSILF